MLLLFLDFPGKLPLCRKRDDFGSYPFFDLPGSVQFDMFLTYVIKVHKEKYSGYILCIL